MNRIPNIAPGEILKEEFLTPYGITAYKLAKETHIPATRIAEILKGRRKITVDTALRLSKYFTNSPEFWLGIQNEFDLREEREKLSIDLQTINSIREYSYT